MTKVVMFRLDPATLQNLETIKQLLPNHRQLPYWEKKETRSSALRWAVSKVAGELVKLEQEKQEKAKPTKAKKKGRVKK